MGHIDNFKKFRNKETKAITEQGGPDLMSVPEKYKAEQAAINQRRNDITNREQIIANDKVALNKMVTELQNKISAENAMIANAAKSTAPQVAPQVPPTV